MSTPNYVAVNARLPFVHESLPGSVSFGHGTRALVGEAAARFGISRALLLYGPPHAQLADELAERLGTRHAARFDGARMHTPVDVTDAAMAIVEAHDIDGIVSVGGGSTTGLSKALALRTDLPQIVLPTTYAGSEMTPILGETCDGVKTTQRSPRILPECVLYDVDLTLDLPASMSGVSGMNAIAHAVEALYARDTNPIIAALALDSVRALFTALPVIAAEPGHRAARADALYGAWLAGVCLGSVGMALHHKLCHVLGGAFDLPHAQTHALVLPHALAYNAPAIPDVTARLAAALGVDDAGRALHRLNAAIGAPRSLAEIGMPESGIARAVELTLANPYWNPQPLDAAGLHGLLDRAWRGAEPLAILCNDGPAS
ncbi:maleylacetate reductase [Burkholderia sp. 22PA0106]|uniref:maleylacetate reductase n=1 Tax=Burkholderia sp. 22PA0106 TaxID=3237371 RepID=UPI0039C28258